MGTQTTCDVCKKVLITRNGSLDNGPRSDTDLDAAYLEVSADLTVPYDEEDPEVVDGSRRFCAVLCPDCAAPLLKALEKHEITPRHVRRRHHRS